jgi:parallel beta-helix repeat protein
VRLGEVTLPDAPEEQAERNEVSNCFIHDGGHVYHAGIGVWIGRSSYNTVRHNEICDFLYSGVSVGWSWGYAPSTAHHNVIELNHIHHLGWVQLSDMGGIYSLGLSPGTVLRQNLIHDVLSYTYGGWGLYTDEGSGGILLENNVVYLTKDGGFHQHYGRENTVRNNVFAFSFGRGQVVRSREETHMSFTFDRNIVYYKHEPLLGGSWRSENAFELDKNVYWNVTGRTPEFPGGLSLAQWQAKGYDVHSVVADPKFVDPEHFDFRLQPDSPALKLGFEPIDTSQIGLVGSPAWVELPRQVQRPAMPRPAEAD